MVRFPLWLAQSKTQILVYDAESKVVMTFGNTNENIHRVKDLVNLSNQLEDPSILTTA